MKKLIWLLAISTLSIVVSTCGLKGPLYLPVVKSIIEKKTTKEDVILKRYLSCLKK